MAQISAACSPIGDRAGANPAHPKLGTGVDGTYLEVGDDGGDFVL
jgi:hypothetical protein